MNYTSLLQPAELFKQIQKLADQQKIEAFVIGGFVRDACLRRPCKDIDIVCVGDSTALAKALAAQVPKTHVTIFKKFGTAMMQWKDFQVEFVHARKESYRHDSRKPIVELGTLRDDILRRDFTINTLAISLNAASFGQLVDMCHGLEDIQAKRIRTPLEGARTFSDDPLRMMRGIRFATQLGFNITEDTLQAMQAQSHRLAIVSKERIMAEFNKILTSGSPKKGLLLLDHVRILQQILPEMELLKGVETIRGMSHKDNFKHTLQVVQNVANALATQAHTKKSWLLWAALLHDIAKPATKRFDPNIGFTFHGHEKVGAKMVPRIFKRLGLPMRQEMRYVQKLVALHLRHIPLVEQAVTDAAIRRFIYDAGDLLYDLILLCRADITSGNKRRVAHYLSNFDKLAKKINDVEEKDRIRNFKPVIDGALIMKTFSLKPCKQVGIIKNSIKDAILEGIIPNDYEEAYAYMLQCAKKIGLQPTC